MFFGFKKKVVLKGIINNYTDIHSHLLPGIDDGADTVEKSALLIKELKVLGFAQIITSPHSLPGVWDNTTNNILSALHVLKTFDKNLCDTVGLRTASEYFLATELIDRVNAGEELLCLKDNYLLVELSYLNPPINLKELLFALQVKGYIPILAHPERYLYYHDNKDMYTELKSAGCLFQLNLLSTVGYYGKRVAKIAEFLLKNDMIDFTGSDVHHMKHVRAFDSKLLIKSVDKLEAAIERNSFFSK